MNFGGKVPNVALEEALKGNVLYPYRAEAEELEPEIPEYVEE